jgi:hypothetical protein
MVWGAIRLPVYVNAEKNEVAVYFYIHGELCIPVQAIQMVKKPLQLL